jgi:hypothetical protein
MTAEAFNKARGRNIPSAENALSETRGLNKISAGCRNKYYQFKKEAYERMYVGSANFAEDGLKTEGELSGKLSGKCSDSIIKSSLLFIFVPFMNANGSGNSWTAGYMSGPVAAGAAA